jgi:DNA-binding NarL/FixJ family response regulator
VAHVRISDHELIGVFAKSQSIGKNAKKKATMIKTLRILIVDDQPRARHGLKALLATRFQLAEMCEAANGIEAIRAVEECKPDIVLMDARMPEMDGVEATRMIKAKSAHTPVIVLSMYIDYQEAALAAGADAFFSKGDPPERLLEALAKVSFSQ